MVADPIRDCWDWDTKEARVGVDVRKMFPMHDDFPAVPRSKDAEDAWLLIGRLGTRVADAVGAAAIVEEPLCKSFSPLDSEARTEIVGDQIVAIPQRAFVGVVVFGTAFGVSAYYWIVSRLAGGDVRTATDSFVLMLGTGILTLTALAALWDGLRRRT